MATRDLSKPLTGFSKLNHQQRLEALLNMEILTHADILHLTSPEKLPTNLAENLVENVLGYFQLPLGVATNFRIDGQDYVIPMVVEETSIIAAASKTSRWIRDQGELTTEILGGQNIGQIQFAIVNDFPKFQGLITDKKTQLIALANQYPAKNLVKRCGGVKDMQIRSIVRPDGKIMAVIHLLVDTCDAMGANTIIQICEYLKPQLQLLTGETVTMCILSNLNDTKITRAKAIIRNIDPELGNKIAEASLFAHLDPYRAATHNKGILNGMDPVVIATGNDWRAVEAAAHAYASRNGQYCSLSHWEMKNGDLIGTLAVPITVGTVGGMTKLHPTAKMSLTMLKINSADQLARIIAAVGLVQNLGALKALVTFGFIEGHLKLHISNLSLSAGASQAEIPLLEKYLEKTLKSTKQLTLSHAIEGLNKIRCGQIQTPIH